MWYAGRRDLEVVQVMERPRSYHEGRHAPSRVLGDLYSFYLLRTYETTGADPALPRCPNQRPTTAKQLMDAFHTGRMYVSDAKV